MMKNFLLVVAVSLASASAANASFVFVAESGVFSSTDTPGTLVAPGGTFSFSFDVPSTGGAVTSTVTSDGFDVAFTNFSYKLNGATVNLTPSDINFDTLGNGGGFDVTFGLGLTAPSFTIFGAQMFTGTTAAPVFAIGSYSVSNVIYSDSVNYDFVPTSSNVSIAAAPEPSTILFASLGMLALIGVSIRKVV
jgi:hypothetical protein